MCDYACAEETSSCATLCATVTSSCEPTGLGSIVVDELLGETWEGWEEDEDEMDADASSAASWLNPLYTAWDPITISGTTFTASAPSPTVAVTSTGSSTSSKTAISATSCGITKTADGSSTSTYCTCDGGFAVDLSTKTNAAHTTFMVCAADPALTVSTITPTSTSTKTKTATGASSTNTGFSIVYVTCETVSCPKGETCDADGNFNFEGVQPHGSGSAPTQISGTYNKKGMVSGTKAKFCDQTSSFTIDGDDVKGSSDDDSYADYTCKATSSVDSEYYDTDNMAKCTKSHQWDCITDICLDDSGDGDGGGGDESSDGWGILFSANVSMAMPIGLSPASKTNTAYRNVPLEATEWVVVVQAVAVPRK